MKMRFKGIFITLFLISNLNAEIAEIQIKWNAFQCLQTCIPLIDNALTKITEISDLQVNGNTGLAKMGWGKNTFNYNTFRLAFAAAGIRMEEMRLKVKGRITHEGNVFFIVSDGDNSRFTLIGPLAVEPGRYTPSNLETHPLTNRMKEQLLDGEKRNLPVLIAGPLYLPNTFTNHLITENIEIIEPKEK